MKSVFNIMQGLSDFPTVSRFFMSKIYNTGYEVLTM
jgi:hypothetical protein